MREGDWVYSVHWRVVMVDAKALETSELDCAAGCGGKDGVKMVDTFEGRVCM